MPLKQARPRRHDPAMPLIGVLALQGDVREHLWALEKVGTRSREVRTQSDLADVDGLIIPGGESTTVGRLLVRFDLLAPLCALIEEGLPVYGTCTGMILMAREIEDGMEGQPLLRQMDVGVRRNAFGRQCESFEAPVHLELPGRPECDVRGVFIRAPVVVSAGPDVVVLGRLDDRIVAVQQGSLLATAFHPELSGDDRLHRYFADLCATRSLAGMPEPAVPSPAIK